MAAVHIFILLTFISLLSPRAAIAGDLCSDENDDVSIIHIYGKCSPFRLPKSSPSWDNTTFISFLVSNDAERLSYLSERKVSGVQRARATTVPVASGQNVLNIGNYVVRAKIGTPPQLMFMVLDTSRDSAWVPCGCCSGPAAPFASNASSSYSSVDCAQPECTRARGLACPQTGSGGGGDCSFNQSYGGDSSFSATLARDTLRLGSDVIPSYEFGCVTSISGNNIAPQGLLGLGRGPTSLLSQAGALYSGLFSYCLPSFKSYYFSGSLKLGPLGQPKTKHTTPLLKNPHRPSLYYVNLTGVSVGKVTIHIPQDLLKFDPNTGSGTVIDSGTVITRFVGPAYEAVRDEFRRQVAGPFSSLGAFDTCFAVRHESAAPTVTFHLEGMDLVLPVENTLIHSSYGNLACLAMAAAPDGVNSVLNVIASLQQQNLRVVFDTVNSRLGITRELCN
ncbi:unnamed protein product [Cuscuta campestris]|uniref:Peptidase A1 domain-containing protein n=1 Tax=Cuscuta campestris TaxID=132261 RepID=A0A484KGV9_9ASTE|nr:unnamed protein product [Cuscuta campestris]